MLVSVVVLIKLLIAMMSDTYQRIQVNTANHLECLHFVRSYDEPDILIRAAVFRRVRSNNY